MRRPVGGRGLRQGIPIRAFVLQTSGAVRPAGVAAVSSTRRNGLVEKFWMLSEKSLAVPRAAIRAANEAGVDERRELGSHGRRVYSDAGFSLTKTTS